MKRNILILFDVYESLYLGTRTSLVQSFLNLYGDANNKFALAINTNSSTFVPLNLTTKDNVWNAITRLTASGSNEALDLTKYSILFV